MFVISDHYVGQIELFSHVPVLKNFVEHLKRKNFNVCAVYLLDSQVCKFKVFFLITPSITPKNVVVYSLHVWWQIAPFISSWQTSQSSLVAVWHLFQQWSNLNYHILTSSPKWILWLTKRILKSMYRHHHLLLVLFIPFSFISIVYKFTTLML